MGSAKHSPRWQCAKLCACLSSGSTPLRGKRYVRSGIRTHAHRSGLRPERSALDHSAILTWSRLPHATTGFLSRDMSRGGAGRHAIAVRHGGAERYAWPDVARRGPQSALEPVRGSPTSRVAQWKRAGPITQRSEDRNLALLLLLAHNALTRPPFCPGGPEAASRVKRAIKNDPGLSVLPLADADGTACGKTIDSGGTRV